MSRLSALCAPACLAVSSAAGADPMAVHATAVELFDRMPGVMEVDSVREVCGGGDVTNPDIAYCTTNNTIYVTARVMDRPTGAYEMAHVLGHAIQVRHGVADVALREITRRPDEEQALRGMVTRQVGCVAGVLMARTGLEGFDFARAFGEEPFTEAYWGRDPLNRGPRVSIGLEARAEWYETGLEANDFSACTVGEMSADLIVDAENAR